MWGHPAPLSGLLVPYGPTYQPRRYVSFPPPPQMHLRCCLSRFDPRAHVGPSGLYNPTLASSRHQKSSSHLRRQKPQSAPSSSSSVAQLVRIDLVGGKQDFAWILDLVKSVVWYKLCTPLSFVSPLFLYASYNCYDNLSVHLIHVLHYDVQCLL